jgi:hypothetical protein
VDGANADGAGFHAANQWTMTALNGLTTNSTHSFQVDYVTTANGVRRLSPPASQRRGAG